MARWQFYYRNLQGGSTVRRQDEQYRRVSTARTPYRISARLWFEISDHANIIDGEQGLTEIPEDAKAMES